MSGSITQWATTASYPAGGNAWSGTPTKTAPGYAYMTPGTTVSAEVINFLLNDISTKALDKTGDVLAGTLAVTGAGSVQIGVGSGLALNVAAGAVATVAGAITTGIAGGITDGARSKGIAATVAGGLFVTMPSTMVAANYTFRDSATAWDYLVSYVITAGPAITVSLPPAPADGRMCVVSDSANAGGVTVAGNGHNILGGTLGFGVASVACPTGGILRFVFNTAYNFNAGAWVIC